MAQLHGANFRIAFDLAAAPDRWINSVGGMYVLPLIGLLLVLIPQRLLDGIPYINMKGAVGRIFIITWFVFTASITGYVTIDHFRQKSTYEALERSEKLSFVEGCLQAFHPMPKSGHDTERIRVRGQAFSYSDFNESSPAFNNSEAFGGPVHADSAVRIWYVENNIIRLAVRDHACPPAADS